MPPLDVSSKEGVTRSQVKCEALEVSYRETSEYDAGLR
jgi:hypothetical protein